MSRYLTPFMTELWQAVVSIGKAMQPGEYRRDPAIATLIREHHGTLRSALQKLADDGYLRVSTSDGRFQPSFWFSDKCKVPGGCEVPAIARPAGTEKASTRQHVNAAMPTDRTPLMQPMSGPGFDYLNTPSRRGDRLVYRDGRVTDMEGNPL